MAEIIKTYDELSEAELADAQRLFPDVRRDAPYRYVIVAGNLHHRISATAPIAVRIVDDKGGAFLAPGSGRRDRTANEGREKGRRGSIASRRRTRAPYLMARRRSRLSCPTDRLVTRRAMIGETQRISAADRYARNE
ncbi:TPA: hypothetical protein ACU9T0_006113 [Burkholderia cenocepacia]|uniref:hypothetical protein n=1 Tax=Burkholderia cenocepacia TaxID=95486 RepID=UPI002AB7B373|nr:hypothetical protein [Burkholderia cenocepacia]